MTTIASRAPRGLAAAFLAFPLLAQAGVHRYEVAVDGALERIAVHACFEGAPPPALSAESDGARFYLESMRLGERVLEPDGDQVSLAGATTDACVDYVVKLQPAQGSAQTGGTETRRVGGSMLTAIGDWLWRAPGADVDLELRFQLPHGVEVSVPWKRTLDTSGRAVFHAGPTPSDWPGMAAFGRFKVRDLEVPGAVLHVALVSLETPAFEQKFMKWVAAAAGNATQLYGRFPVESLQVVVAPAPRGRTAVPWAYVSRGGGPAIHLFVNAVRPEDEFLRDWSLTHEMAHLFLPYIAARDAWLYEGVATYLQNGLMARGGAISEDEAWRRMQAGFERGAATAPDLSLTRANERVGFGGVYLRVYWAGAAVMLEADLRLRNLTAGAQSLDTALEKLARCCAAENRRWTAAEIVGRLDQITGTTVFSDVVNAQLAADGFPDYRGTLARAGVSAGADGTQIDGSAAWALAASGLMRPAR